MSMRWLSRYHQGCHKTRFEQIKRFARPFMGSGASKAPQPQQRQSLHQSDCRAFDLAQKPANDGSIVYINSVLQDWVKQRRPRARSLPELSGNDIPQQLLHQPSASHQPAIPETSENSAPEPTPAVVTPLVIVLSPQEPLSPAPSSGSDTYRLDRIQEGVNNGQDEVVFGEDDVIDWKKGESIGSGSYGAVYLARNERTGSMMAVKEIRIDDENNADVQQATKEVELLRSLQHVHIVKYLGSYVDRPASTLHIFTEWVPGGNLEQQRKRFGSNELVVRRFAAQILSGVAYLHSKNIVHQDIKPSNILIDQNGVVKLADFGASRLISSTTCVNNESMRGTPNYMAPEVVKQTLRGRKADIWSVGCSVLRMLTGLPFWGSKRFDSQIALLYYIANLESIPPLPGDLSPDAKSFILSCLEIDPFKRPTAIELLQHPFVQLQSSRKYAHRSPRQGFTSKSGSPGKKPGITSNIYTPPPSNSSSSSKNGSPTAVPLLASISKGPDSSVARMPARMPLLARPDSFGLPEIEEAEMSLVSSRRGQSNLPSLSGSKHSQHQRIDHSLAKRGGNTGRNAVDLGEYTYSDFTEPLSMQQSSTLSLAREPSIWEDQPIITDAARQERENEAIRRAMEKQKQAERERKFQEELVEFRRQLQPPTARSPT